MTQIESINLIDKMIAEVPECLKEFNEILVSNDIYNALGFNKYKGYYIKTIKQLPRKYAIIGSKYF
jgi:hypothetical protein